MKKTLEYKILKYLSENDSGQLVDVSQLCQDKVLLKSKLLSLRKEKLISFNSGYAIAGIPNSTWLKAKIEFKGLDYLDSLNNKSNMTNDFSGSTIGQVNQSEFLKVDKTEIKQTNHLKTKEKQQNSIVSFIVKFWWQILIPLLIGIVLLMIEKGVIDIGF